MENRRRVMVLVLLIFTLILTGTIGYRVLLDIPLVDALYMTVITVSTVGYKEVTEMTPEAKLFSMFIIIMSIGTVGYVVSNIVSLFVEGEIKEAWKLKRMENTISKLENHYIICGAGETGFYTLAQFKKQNIPFVVIDSDKKVIEELKESDILYVEGDATHEGTLNKARIAYAKGLVATLPKDADNVYTVLTARQMNSELHIVARAVEENASEKLKKAGANNTVSPNEIGGIRMATMMLRPKVISFLDAITHAGDVVLSLEDVNIREGSSLCDLTLKDSAIPEKTGLIVLALRRKEEKNMFFNPGPNERLYAGDAMVVLGRDDQVKKLREIAHDTEG